MDAADSTTNSSKVIVQCHDPSNLFEQVVARLEPRLPLSKLHWKSPNRPLRSIDQLNVSLTRDDTKLEGTTSARRHQIPGLRQTPFVKLYLVRCDERAAYKETCRKEVKQWLKGQGISQDGKNLMKGQERHDAYEYIILHVVLPGTAAAAQPKSSKHISLEASDSTDSLNSKSKWTGKSSSTVYDKLRADFSSSSKAPFERVAQVRITDPENHQPAALGASEVEEQWQDLIEKLKTAILLSFDARVSQYEEDIREREAQRQIPGWNFCTFFILKEGLARGFENVGLLEDAMTVYEELDVGLDHVVQEQISQEDSDSTGALIPFSTDLKPIIRTALETQNVFKMDDPIETDPSLQTLIDLERINFPFDIERRNYQQRILTNQASTLDFHIYIFTRQLHLLSRQAKLVTSAHNPRNSVRANTKTQYDLNLVAEICEKATTFIPFAARALRTDLYSAWGGQQGLDDNELQTQKIVIGAIVASWKWSAIMQILADCDILSLLSHILIGDMLSVTSEERADQGTRSGNTNEPTAGHEDLAMWAGELFSTGRDIISATILFMPEDSSENDGAKGIQSQSLSQMFYSRPAASEVLKMLTLHAYQCFQSANRISASHRMLHAIAEIEVANDNVDAAVEWLERIPDLRTLPPKSMTDRTLLNLYARCLKKQGRRDDYARTLVTLMLSSAMSPVARALPRSDEQAQYLLNELLAVSDKVAEIQLPLKGFFAIRSVDKSISFEHTTHGFSFRLSLSLRFNASVEVSRMDLRMTNTDGQGLAEIKLELKDTIKVNGSASQATFISNVITEGLFNLSQLTVWIGQIALTHDFQPSSTGNESKKIPAFEQSLPTMVFPNNESFLLSAGPSASVDLTQPGRILFEVSVGVRDLDECYLHLRPASAGVRLDIRAVRCIDDDESGCLDVQRQSDIQVLLLRGLKNGSKVAFEVPYTSETLSSTIAIKVEAAGHTPDGSFTAFYQRTVDVNLHISVNVQDIFQVDSLFSRFTAAPSTIAPVRLLQWSIDEGSSYAVRPSSFRREQIDIFPRMSASWIIEAVDLKSGRRAQGKLPLTVQYHSFEDVILKSIEWRFRHDLIHSPVNFTSELLVPHMLSHIRDTWTEQELELSVLLQEFEMFSFELMNWIDVLRALDLREQEQVEAWLRKWHSQHQNITLDVARAKVREVNLSVEIPTSPVVVSTSINLHVAQETYLVAGVPTSAKLTIECACDTDTEILVQFDIASQPDTWVVGGKKRGMIVANKSKHTFDIILIAQKPGHLLLPGVDVKSRRSGERNGPIPIGIEVENRSQAKSVLVIPNLHATTVAIGVNEAAGRHWLVDSRSRTTLS